MGSKLRNTYNYMMPYVVAFMDRFEIQTPFIITIVNKTVKRPIAIIIQAEDAIQCLYSNNTMTPWKRLYGIQIRCTQLEKTTKGIAKIFEK